MQFYFSQTMTDKVTHSGQSQLMDLYMGDVAVDMGWYNIGGMTTIGVLVSLGLILTIIITAIVLMGTKMCKACRQAGSGDDAADGSNAETNNEIAELVEPGFDDTDTKLPFKRASTGRARRNSLR
jgi:hypothetical protein